jgi:hypothetical protein
MAEILYGGISRRRTFKFEKRRGEFFMERESHHDRGGIFHEGDQFFCNYLKKG